MLKLIVPGTEYYNEETETFETVGDVELELEHSLISLSKWESKHQKPFLTDQSKSAEEIYSYLEAMIISPIYPKDILFRLDTGHINLINAYIDSPECATTFGSMPERKTRGEIITAELIYYWMIAFNIPFECEVWHLNRLFALIRVCNIKNAKPKKMSKHEMAMQYRDLNAQRRAQYGTKG